MPNSNTSCSPGAQKFIEGVAASVEGNASGDTDNLDTCFGVAMAAAKNSTPEKEPKMKIMNGYYEASSEDDEPVQAWSYDEKKSQIDASNQDKMKDPAEFRITRMKETPNGRQRATYSSKDRGRNGIRIGAPSTRTTRRTDDSGAIRGCDKDNTAVECVTASDSPDPAADSPASKTSIESNTPRSPTRKIPNARKKSAGESRRTPHPNEYILDELIEQAEFEINHDPYRVMGIFQENGGSPPTENPWAKCMFSSNYRRNAEHNKEQILNLENCNKDDIDGLVLAKAWVEEISQCHCPSLIRWTQDSIIKERLAAKKKKSKKRKLPPEAPKIQPPAVGQRPLDLKARCPCDYNPICTGSLGGIVNEIVREQTIALYERKKSQHENYQELIRAQTGGRHSSLANNKSQPDQTNKGIFFDGWRLPEGEDTVLEVEASQKASSDEEDVEVIDKDNKNNDETDYEPETARQLARLRQCCMVDVQPIKEYLDRILHAAESDYLKDASVPKLLRIFNRWQSSLIFPHPLRDCQKPTSSHVPIAMPPGISNLGATCYLNTQLQCLAQNRAFLKGIASWRAAEKTGNGSMSSEDDRHSDVMNSVLTSLQSLMANLMEGCHRSVSTLEFSTALGLEHNEQQDPNEFARLLFERMHEAFQQQHSLRTLLPSLFEGSTNYYTRCLTCNNVSTRRESFMDLNLPIVKPPKEADGEKPKRGFGKTIKDYFSSFLGTNSEPTSILNADVDTTLQYCLDEYSTVEELKGDNQYFCSVCGCKKDATRETALGTLPPILNVQLSRYVFDMTSFAKKKVTDKVLLPRKLTVQTKETEAAGDNMSTKTYVLCAVMKHLGNSAYRGHYVAEVQDFLSGQWFEFNDEKVNLLRDGPSCSYTPTSMSESEDTEMPDADDSEGNKSIEARKKTKLVGSEEAYNTYYVEESFLSATVLQAYEVLKSQLKDQQAVLSGEKKPTNDDIIQSVARQRQFIFHELSDLCLEDGKATQRVRARMAALKTDMLAFKATNSDKSMSPVWVDGNLLRCFVAGKRLDGLFRTPPGEPLLRHQHLLCTHEKLHPRIARRGKLLPRHMYNSYMDLLASERCLFLNEDSTKRDPKDSSLWDKLNDYHITPKHNLRCEDCAAFYRDELKEKVCLVKRLHYLYAELDVKQGGDHEITVAEDRSDSEDSEGSDKYAFVASKKSLTAFRKKIENDLLKGLANVTASKANLSKSAVTFVDEAGAFSYANDVAIESLAEGLDALDLSMFSFKNMNEDGDLDVQINSSITCPHGRCDCLTNKGKVRWLTRKVWHELKQVFPKAIEHKVLRSGKDAKSMCSNCANAEKSKNNLEKKLTEWYQEALSQGHRDLKDLCKDTAGDQGLASFLDFSAGKLHAEDVLGDYLPIARSDVVIWREMINAVEALKKNKSDGPLVKNQIESLLSSRRPDWRQYENVSLEECFLRRLKCKMHGMALPIFERDPASENGSIVPRGVQLLTSDRYAKIVGSIGDLLKILSSPTDDVILLDLSDDETPLNPEVPDHLKAPQVLVNDPVGEPDLAEDCEAIRIVAPNGKPVYLSCFPKFCGDPTCQRNYLDTLEPDDEVRGRIGQKADDPIVVIESDGEDTKDKFTLKVFEVKSGADIYAAYSDLMDLDALPGMAISTVTDVGPRRSTRKRKARFPSGAILGQDTVQVAMQHNLSALRLLLFQACGDKFDLDQKLTLVFLSPFPPDDCEGGTGQHFQPQFKELPFESNKEELNEIYVKWTGDAQMEGLSNPGKNLIMLRQKATKESLLPHEALMDSLLESANTISKLESTGNSGKKKKPAERGFTGTLLSSVRRPTIEDSPAIQSNGKERNQSADKESTQLTSKKAFDQIADDEFTSADAKKPEAKETNDYEGHEAIVTKNARNGSTENRGGKKRKAVNFCAAAPSVLESIEEVGGKSENQKLAEVLEGMKVFVAEAGGRFKAATWAVENNKAKSVEELVEIGVCKFYDN